MPTPRAARAKSKNPASSRFLDYLKSPPATDVFRRYGYVTQSGG